jgi:hypothetical protein
MRPPAVAGVAGGVGTTTLAMALRGRDGGPAAAADVLACRATMDSLRQAADVLERAGPGPRPVLAVTLDGARLPRGPVRARLRVLEPETSAVVLLPHVRTWRTADDPAAEAATLLVEPVERVPWALQAYATAVHDLAAAVVASGRLQTPPDRADVAATPDHPLRSAVPAVDAPTRRRAAVVSAAPPVVRTSRPDVDPAHDAAPHRGIRIVTRVTPPVVARPVERSSGRRTRPGATAGPDERAERAG